MPNNYELIFISVSDITDLFDLNAPKVPHLPSEGQKDIYFWDLSIGWMR